MTKGLEDSEGNEYRYVYSERFGRTVVEYRPPQLQESDVSFRAFVVKFRGEEWHVSALSAEAARCLFASEFSSTSPRPEEVTVTEV